MAENRLIARRGLVHLGSTLAWVPLGLTLALAAGTVVFGVLDGRWEDAVALIPALAFASVGSIIATKRSENPIGWLFCAVGITLALGVFGEAYGYHGLVAEPGSLRGSAYAVSIAAEIGAVPLFAGTLLLLLFPTGAPPSRRWRPLVWLQAVGVVVSLTGILQPGPFEEEPFTKIENPLGIAGSGGTFGHADEASWIIAMPSLALGAVALVLRYRRAVGTERQQLKWMVSAGIVAAVALVVNGNASGEAPKAVADALWVVAVIALTAVPIAAGLAILRYRLYELDVIIRRTLVYGAVTAGLAGLYFAIVLLLQQVFSSFAGGSDIAIAGSTLAVAALFRPVRNRIQALVDRRFYRRSYDTQRTLEAFNARLREEIDLGTLRRELLAVVDETMRPANLSLWLRSGR